MFQTLRYVSVTQCCGQDGQFQSAIEVEAVMLQYHRSDAQLIFTGDLNVQNGCENRYFCIFFHSNFTKYQKYYLIHSETNTYFKGNLDGAYTAIVLEDTFVSINGEDGSTYPGVCKIDYVFASTEHNPFCKLQNM